MSTHDTRLWSLVLELHKYYTVLSIGDPSLTEKGSGVYEKIRKSKRTTFSSHATKCGYIESNYCYSHYVKWLKGRKVDL